jgi:hypothetical protein
MAMPIKVLTTNDFKNIMAKKTIMGEISIPKRRLNGMILLTGAKIGSVAL